MAERTLIEHNGEAYKLSYTDEVIETVEKLTGHSVMSAIYQNDAMIPLTDLKYLFIFGLMEATGGKRVQQNKAQKIFNDVKGVLGYQALVGLFLEAFQEDCGFFFQVN